jgi:uncharacterized SAM-dependent methyltransferase
MPAAKESVLGARPGADTDIIDIRGPQVEYNLADDIAELFAPSAGGPRRLPTLLLYDEQGLQLFERVCCCPDR